MARICYNNINLKDHLWREE